MKRLMLLHIYAHEALDARRLLKRREEEVLFEIVVVVHGFVPALAVSEEVGDQGERE